MASGWVKSLHCKSRAFEDVHHPNPKSSFLSSSSSFSSSSSSYYTSSCRRSAQTIKDVIEIAKQRPKKPKPKPESEPDSERRPLCSIPPANAKRRAPPSKESVNRGTLPDPSVRARASGRISASARAPEPASPVLTELAEGHPSRNVVEIIFHTSWGPKAFPGRIDVIFKLENGPRAAARFEEYRELVKSRAGSGHPGDEDGRCAADGNEVMRFRSMGPTPDGSEGGSWGLTGGKGAAICTFSGSGSAHESAGGGKGRRAMVVCRVIAGRISKRLGFEPGRATCDSVSGDDGELLVFDSRAVLPCFLIIYRL